MYTCNTDMYLVVYLCIYRLIIYKSVYAIHAPKINIHYRNECIFGVFYYSWLFSWYCFSIWHFTIFYNNILFMVLFLSLLYHQSFQVKNIVYQVSILISRHIFFTIQWDLLIDNSYWILNTTWIWCMINSFFFLLFGLIV